MCGRFTLGVEPVELQEAFDLSEAPVDWVLRENIAPTQPVAVLASAETRRIEYMRWGLIPSWAKDISIGSKMFNARAETIQEKPSFKTAFARRRCLIPADGFYEWQKQEKGPSKPFRFQLKGKQPFAFAGLWELWRSPEGDELKSCTHHHHRCQRNGGQGAPPHASDPGYNQLLAMAGEKGCKWLAGDARGIPSGIDGVKAGGANAKRPIMKILDRNGEVR